MNTNIETTLFDLAAEHGLALDSGPYQTDTDTDVTLWRDDDGWHITAADGRELHDMDWAPNDDESAESLRGDLGL